MVQLDRPHMKICCMRLVCWIHKATNTQSAYVMLVAFPTQLLHERPSMLCYVIRTLPTLLSYDLLQINSAN